MKYSAAYRSGLEAVSALLLTRVVDVGDFATYVTTFYPIYFIANLLFSSSTVDFAGGRQDPRLTRVLAAAAFFAIATIVFTQNTPLNAAYFLFAGLTLFESIAFVICESTRKTALLMALLMPRIIITVALVIVTLIGVRLRLEDVIMAFLFRDFALFLLGMASLLILNRNPRFLVAGFSINLSELCYIVVANAQDFIMRILVDMTIGAAFVKELEYALRLPRFAQTGLYLALRPRIFRGDTGRDSPALMRRLHLFSFVLAAVIALLAVVGLVGEQFLVVLCGIFMANTVPWYIEMLRSRRFSILIFAQMLSFVVTIAAVVVFKNVYVSVALMSFVLFLFSVAGLTSGIRMVPRAGSGGGP